MGKVGSIATCVGSCLGALVFVVGFLGANGAPQEASASAAGVALAVIPYCFARAVHELSRGNR